MASSNEDILKEPFNVVASAESQFAEIIRRIAGSDCPLLVIGERGAGKRSISELLHSCSHRSAALCKSLAAAEADYGMIMSALPGSGTLILLDAADLALDAQEELVRRYEHSSTVGQNRLICTTRHDLAEAVQDGRMREDFYYFISSVSLRVPPLRYRKGELLILAEDMLGRYARQYDRPKPLLSSEICAFLLKHTWPGNLDELEVSMKTCVAIGDSDFSLAALRAAAPKKHRVNRNDPQISLKAATRAASNRVERQLISEVLRATDGNRKQTAKDLRISYKTLLSKLKQTGLSNVSTHSASGGRL